MKEQRGCRSIAVPIHTLEARRELLIKDTPRPLYPLKQDALFLLQEVWCASCPVWTQTKIFTNH